MCPTVMVLTAMRVVQAVLAVPTAVMTLVLRAALLVQGLAVALWVVAVLVVETVAVGIAVVLVALRVVTVVGWRGRWWGWHLPTRALLDMGSLMGTCRWCVLSRACWMASLVRPRCSFTALLQFIGPPLTPAGPLAL